MEQFDCSTCALACMQASLRPENAVAWQVFQWLARRFVVDFGVGPEVLRQVLRDLDGDDAIDLVDRLALIYDAVHPARTDAES